MLADPPLLEALDRPNPERALRAAVERLLAEQRDDPKASDRIYAALNELRLQFDADDPRLDAVLDVMDLLVGWCAPSARLVG